MIDWAFTDCNNIYYSYGQYGEGVFYYRWVNAPHDQCVLENKDILLFLRMPRILIRNEHD